MRINENTALTVSVNLLESDRTAALPSSLEWRLECLETGTVLQDWTSLTITDTYDDDENLSEAEATISVSALLNTMQTGKKVEKKALCIAADRGLSTEFNDEIIYEVERLNARS